ncbi:MAG: glycosyltransferase [Aliarcobacter skirrowii]|uniref:glycosyltransferase family 2 protein n=1 Tax=Aliarcobacter skirrowii TaxID=28200 RepID=UPI00242AAE96|nr:glycosyltransferase family 2 protein [Aliarcobacter skirrowii]MDD2509187.1 glycosyltransferase [Aliarcobacter skirrowii]MDD3497459.1 glycosyltransferase [Aliarcobacter skirrowii]
MSNSLISIIIPIYNSERYLKRCLDTVVSQSLKDIEIICIDDCSTDKSIEIVEDFITYDKRVKLFKNKRNRGVSFCRNYGIKIANSDYIGFVDSDDSIDINMYKTMYELAKQDDSCMVICNFRAIDKFGIKDFKTFSKNQTKETLFKKTLSKELAPFPVNRIYKKELFIKNKIAYIENRVYEDAEATHKLIYYADKISICEDIFYNYHINPNSITTSFENKKIDDIFYVLESTKKFLKNVNIFEIYNEEYFTMIKISVNNVLYHLIQQKISLKIKLRNLEYLWKNIFSYEDINSMHYNIILLWLYKSFLILKDNKMYFDIFCKNISFNKKIVENMKNLVYEELGLSYNIIKQLKENKISTIYLYGAGDIAKKLIPEIENLSIEILGIIDSHAKKNDSLLGYSVNKFEDIDFQSKIIVVSSEYSAYEITTFLENQVEDFEIINFYSIYKDII